MAGPLANACNEYLTRLRLPDALAPKLEEKVRKCVVGCDSDFKLVEEEGASLRVVAINPHKPCADVWLIPHALSTTRSELFNKLENDEKLKEECVQLVRLPKEAGVTDVFLRFWRWCAPEAMENNEDMEVRWHLLPRTILWIPHADDGNVAVCPLPQNISGGLMSKFPYGLSMLFVLQTLKPGQLLKRDLLPVRRTLQRVSRLVTLIGDDEDRWAHPTERQGLNQVYQCAAPPSPMLWDPVKDLGEKGDVRPRMAATEFSPEVMQVYTDYPLVAKALTHKSFELVYTFENCHILFACNPIAGFFAMGQRVVNQFPHEQCIINPRLLMHTVRLSSQPHHNVGKISDQGGQTLPPWFPALYDLKTEVNHFLAEYKRRQAAGKNNFWMIRSGDLGNEDWCLSDDTCTIVKYVEANSGNWVIQEAIDPPLKWNGRKLILSVFLLVRSFGPVDAYMYKDVFGRVGSKKFNRDERSLHDPAVHIPYDSVHSQSIPMEDVKKAICQNNLKWEHVENLLKESLRGLLDISKRQMGEWPRSRALYRVDFGLPESSDDDFHPKILMVGFAPNLDYVLASNQNFVNEVFQVLFLDGPIPNSMISLSNKSD